MHGNVAFHNAVSSAVNSPIWHCGATFEIRIVKTPREALNLSTPLCYNTGSQQWIFLVSVASRAHSTNEPGCSSAANHSFPKEHL